MDLFHWMVSFLEMNLIHLYITGIFLSLLHSVQDMIADYRKLDA